MFHSEVLLLFFVFLFLVGTCDEQVYLYIYSEGARLWRAGAEATVFTSLVQLKSFIPQRGRTNAKIPTRVAERFRLSANLNYHRR